MPTLTHCEYGAMGQKGTRLLIEALASATALLRLCERNARVGGKMPRIFGPRPARTRLFRSRGSRSALAWCSVVAILMSSFAIATTSAEATHGNPPNLFELDNNA